MSRRPGGQVAVGAGLSPAQGAVGAGLSPAQAGSAVRWTARLLVSIGVGVLVMMAPTSAGFAEQSCHRAAGRLVSGMDWAGLSPAPTPASPPSLVSTDSLASWLARGDRVQLLDVRTDVFAYLAGHVPGAQHLSIETLRASRAGTPAQLLGQAAYARLFSRLGLSPEVPVVVYSAGETLNIDATFVVWLLWSMGHRRVYLLDGGYRAWELEQRDITQQYPRTTATTSWAKQPFRPPVATLDEVRRAIGSGAMLVDARPPEQYAGKAGAQMRRGHIPGAVSHYWQDDLETRGFGRVWRPVDQLRVSYVGQGITPERDIILYCNTATEASHLFFALKFLLGYPKVRIYAGSWTEWAEQAELPIENGER